MNVKIYGMQLSRGYEGLIRCSTCGRILGSVNTKGMNEFYMLLLCRCGSACALQISAHNPVHFPQSYEQIYEKQDHLICQSCQTFVASINKHSVLNYAFRICCGCGKRYDKKHHVNSKSRY